MTVRPSRSPRPSRPARRPVRRLARPAVLALLLTGALAACGEETSDAGDDPTAPSTSESAPAWQQVDPCSLVDDQTVERLLGRPASGEPDDSFADRPTCVWTGETEYDTVKVQLWEPPLPDAVTQNDRTVPVGDHVGYVTTETGSGCYLDVEADPFVTVEVDASADQASDRFCAEVAAPLAEDVLAQLA